MTAPGSRLSIAPRVPVVIAQNPPHGAPLHVWIGMVLWVLWAAQLLFPLSWGPLQTLRTSLDWRLATGAGLALYLAVQGYLPYLRLAGHTGAASRQLRWHRRLGVLAPILFSLHAPAMGYGFLRALAICFVVNATFALGGYDLSRRSRRWWLIWVNAHIVAALLLVALGTVHVVTALYYE